MEPAREAELAAHLAQCPSCARFEAEQARLNALLASEAMEWEPPPRIWSRIEERLSERPEGFWEALVRSLGEALAAPGLRPALAGLLVMLCLSLALINLPGHRDTEFLAELEAYEMKVESRNPFLRQDSSWNPFFQMDVGRDKNLFDQTRNQR